MRAYFVIAASVAGLVAGTAVARAADLEVESSGHGSCCQVDYGGGQVVILDNQPGVVIRRWWLPPWRNRHYYPHGQWASKKVEKSESAPPTRVADRQARPAPGYDRYWSNPRSLPTETAPFIGDDTPLPRANPYRVMPPVVVVPTVRP